MRSAAIRLDSFSAGMTVQDQQRISSQAYEEAFQLGFEQGLNDGRERSLDALTDTITVLAGEIARQEAQSTRLRHETLLELAPALITIIEQLGAKTSKDRLLDALTSELRQICGDASPRKLLIKCSSDMQPDVAECIAKSGLPGAQFETTSDSAMMVDLIADKTAITFDPAATVSGLKTIINDILSED